MSQYKNLDWQNPGLSDVGSYQVSAIPYVTGGISVANTSVLTINFPSVTSWIYVAHDSNQDLRVGFSANGVNDGYFLMVHGDASKAFAPPIFPVKCSSIYLRGDSNTVAGVTVFAGLTNIPTTELKNSGPNGANWSGSAGIG